MGEHNETSLDELPAPLADRLRAICASSGFQRSPCLQRFLQYVVRHSTVWPNKPLKELQIAIDVFDRRTNFDPQIDPIVLVKAGRLRLRMTEYYAGPGQDDEILIEIGRGGYLASFRNNPGRSTLPVGSNGSARARRHTISILRDVTSGTNEHPTAWPRHWSISRKRPRWTRSLQPPKWALPIVIW